MLFPAKKLLPLFLLLLLAACVGIKAVPASLTPPPLPAATQQPSTPPDLATRLREKIEESGQNTLFFGGSVLAAQDGVILVSQGVGMADEENKVPNTPQTRFRLGSVTKQFTSMAIMMLQERKKLNVQDLVCQYLPDCPPAWQEVTIHHLLTHTSGIPNFTSQNSYAATWATPSTPIQTIDRFIDRPLIFEPGERFSYSNSGYIVLGYLIELVSGQSYEAFLQENIFDPLEMTNTGYDHNRGDLAVGYVALGLEAPYIDMSIPYAAGGLYSTVEDLYLWDQALYTDRLLSQDLLDLMWTPYAQEAPKIQYGYGWEISDHDGHHQISHNGGVNGFTSVIIRYPAERTTVIVLSNFESRTTFTLGDQLAEILLESK